MNFLFNGGCIWGVFEYIGAIRYIKEHDITYDKLYGISAGGGIAVCLLLDIDIDELISYNERIVNETAFKSLTEIQRLGVEFVFEGRPDAYKLANNRLFIGLTNKNGFYFKSTFTSNDDLANAMICGGTVPLFSHCNSICDGHHTIDGGIGFTDEHLPINTIVIRPTAPFPLAALPPPVFLQKLLIAMGYRNAEHYIQTNNIVVGDMWYSSPGLLPLWLYIHANTI